MKHPATSEKLKAKWADPEYRAAQIARMKATRSTPEYRAGASARAKAQAEKRRLAKEKELNLQLVRDPEMVDQQSPPVFFSSVTTTFSSVLGNQHKPILIKLLQELEEDKTPAVQEVVAPKSYRFGDYR